MRSLIGYAVTTAIVAMILAGCATTNLTGVWLEPSFQGPPLKSVMIIGVAKDRNVRKRFEDSFARQFRSNGIRAASGHDLIPSESILTSENLKKHKAIIKQAAEANKMQALLVTRLIGVEHVDEYIPPTYIAQPPHYYGRFDDYYTRTWNDVYTQGSYLTRKYVRLETRIYDTASEKLIWSASSETIDPSSVDSLFSDLIEVVIKRLKKDGLVAGG
jgi:hypothetical protein